MDESTRNKIRNLREIVRGVDIESPGIPEYVEHHDSIQKILKYINTELLDESKQTTEEIPETEKESLLRDYAEDCYEEFLQIFRFEGKVTLKDVRDIFQLESSPEDESACVQEEQKMLADNWDLFEDRVRSLLVRWRRFRNSHRADKHIASQSIQGFLIETYDEYTKRLMGKENGEDVHRK